MGKRVSAMGLAALSGGWVRDLEASHLMQVATIDEGLPGRFIAEGRA